MKCLVKGCSNETTQGIFVGELCAPCHAMLAEGLLSSGQTFIHDLAEKLKDAYEELEDLREQAKPSVPDRDESHD